MKFLRTSVAAMALQVVSARFLVESEGNDRNVVLHPEQAAAETYLVELEPGKTKWVTEEEKWELRRNGQRFFDITETRKLGTSRLAVARQARKSAFPKKCAFQDDVKPLLANLSKTEMETNLQKFTSFHTRYYKSDYGRDSSDWLLGKIRAIIKDAGAQKTVHAEPFPHSWQQSSIIATIPGRTNRTVIIGAHQDSINLWFPSVLSAPGADDDGSGSITILEVFRTLLSVGDVVDGKAENTIEFHWYSAEEGGLLGSQAIFQSYESAGRDVKAMLQQDMTGFVQRTIDAGQVESVGVITDFVDAGLTEFIKKVIVEYCTIPYIETKCGYACSDHASASKAGYPSAFVIESSFEQSDPHIHTSDDVIKYLSFDHMLEHARMTLGLVYELGHADFAALERTTSPSEVMGEL